VSHNEDVQVLKYSQGQYYHSHMDWTELELYPDQKQVWKDAHFGYQDRLATVFWYLNDVPAGGETVFPKHNQTICAPKLRGGPGTSSCEGSWDPDITSCEGGIKIKPVTGTALLWYNFHASGRGDRNSLHGGCPVGRGYTKWSGNKWVNIKPLSSKSSWINGHPALARHGWADARDASPCKITFENNAKEKVGIMWKNNAGKLQQLGRLPPGTMVSQNSFNGHKFVLQGKSRQTREVWCKAPEIHFALTQDFELWMERDLDEL